MADLTDERLRQIAAVVRIHTGYELTFDRTAAYEVHEALNELLDRRETEVWARENQIYTTPFKGGYFLRVMVQGESFGWNVEWDFERMHRTGFTTPFAALSAYRQWRLDRRAADKTNEVSHDAS